MQQAVMQLQMQLINSTGCRRTTKSPWLLLTAPPKSCMHLSVCLPDYSTHDMLLIEPDLTLVVERPVISVIVVSLQMIML